MNDIAALIRETKTWMEEKIKGIAMIDDEELLKMEAALIEFPEGTMSVMIGDKKQGVFFVVPSRLAELVAGMRRLKSMLREQTTHPNDQL